MKFRKFLQNQVASSVGMNIHGANAMHQGGSGHYGGAENLICYQQDGVVWRVAAGEHSPIRPSGHLV